MSTKRVFKSIEQQEADELRMQRQARLKEAYDFLRFRHVFESQEQVAIEMGASPSNVSGALTGKERILTTSFITRFNQRYPGYYNLDWLLWGNGPKFADPSLAAFEPAAQAVPADYPDEQPEPSIASDSEVVPISPTESAEPTAEPASSDEPISSTYQTPNGFILHDLSALASNLRNELELATAARASVEAELEALRRERSALSKQLASVHELVQRLTSLLPTTNPD